MSTKRSSVAGDDDHVMMIQSNDAGRPIGDDDDDDNEKQSKIRRSSQEFLRRAVILVAVITVLVVVVQQLHDPNHHHSKYASVVGGGGSGGGSGGATTTGGAATTTTKTTTTDTSTTDATASKEWLAVDTQLAQQVQEADVAVRAKKRQPDIMMEVDPEGVQLTTRLQDLTRKLLDHRYGYPSQHSKIRAVVNVILPSTIPDYDVSRDKLSHPIVYEFGPPELIPCSVYYMMEIIRTYTKGSIHRNANHVLQANAESLATQHHVSMPFQEYSPNFPHKKYTTGYAGRPSGPGWYISIRDNTRNHGPGSQQQKNPHEADALFGTIIMGHETIQRIHSVPQDGWLTKENEIHIPSIQLVVPKLGVDVNTIDMGVHTASDWMDFTLPSGISNDQLFITTQKVQPTRPQ